MKIYKSIEELSAISNSVVTQGMFDGVHIGHQQVLDKVVALAKESGGESLIITYWPHPRHVFGASAEELPLLTTLEEKMKFFEERSIDHVLIIPFTKEFSQMSAKEFIKQILVDKANVKKFIVGYDQKIGHNRESGFEQIIKEAQKFGFDVVKVEKKTLTNGIPGSGIIRELLSKGAVEKVSEFLGRNYSIHGRIKKNKDFIKITDDYKLIPQEGYYEVEIVSDKIYKGNVIINNRENKMFQLKILDPLYLTGEKDVEVRFLKKLL
jgi:riboflavin kinase / FMN adenylyltransferase